MGLGRGTASDCNAAACTVAFEPSRSMAMFGGHAAATNQHRHCARLSLSLRVSVESHVATLLQFGAQRLVQLAARQMTAAVGLAEPLLRQVRRQRATPTIECCSLSFRKFQACSEAFDAPPVGARVGCDLPARVVLPNAGSEVRVIVSARKLELAVRITASQ